MYVARRSDSQEIAYGYCMDEVTCLSLQFSQMESYACRNLGKIH